MRGFEGEIVKSGSSFMKVSLVAKNICVISENDF